VKSAHGSTVYATVTHQKLQEATPVTCCPVSSAPCRNRTYNLMIKSQNPSILAPLGNLASPSIEDAPLVQRTRGEDAPNFHAISHGASSGVLVSQYPPNRISR
jgi:hypothetical protein